MTKTTKRYGLVTKSTLGKTDVIKIARKATTREEAREINREYGYKFYIQNLETGMFVR